MSDISRAEVCAVACAEAATLVGAVADVGRDRLPLLNRVTATAMIAISAAARMTVTTMPPIGARAFGGGLVSN